MNGNQLFLPKAVLQDTFHFYKSRQESEQLKWLHLPIPADERICAAVVFELGFPFGFEFWDAVLGDITLAAFRNARQRLTGIANLPREV